MPMGYERDGMVSALTRPWRAGRKRVYRVFGAGAEAEGLDSGFFDYSRALPTQEARFGYRRSYPHPESAAHFRVRPAGAG